MSPRPETETLRIGRRIIEITHADKVLFPKDGITKRELVTYYQRIAPIMLPHLRGRPIMMERYPNGIHSKGFFEKNTPPYYPEWIKRVSLPKKGGVVNHAVCGDAATLVYLANQAVITPHTWLSQIDRPNHPDQMIFDLDPSGEDFSAIREAAKDLRGWLIEQGLIPFVKTTGSRGLHVLVPLLRRLDFDEVRAFAREIAKRFVESDPKHLTMETQKDKRQGRIFVDTVRNAYAQTAAPAYAVRPRDGAPVSTPLHWGELDGGGVKSDSFNLRNIFDRIRDTGDPWKDLKRYARALPR